MAAVQAAGSGAGRVGIRRRSVRAGCRWRSGRTARAWTKGWRRGQPTVERVRGLGGSCAGNQRQSGRAMRADCGVPAQAAGGGACGLGTAAVQAGSGGVGARTGAAAAA